MKYIKVIIDQIKNLLICFFICFLCGIFYKPLHNFFSDSKYGKEFSPAIILIDLIFCTIYLFAYKSDLKISKFSNLDLKMILYSFLLPIFLTIGICLVENTSISYNFFQLNVFYLFIPFFIFALFEEIICRFALLGKNFNSPDAYFRIFTSSLLFSLLHFGNNSYDIIPFIVLFLSGIILSIVYLKTNLLTSTIVHTFWNTSSSVIMGGNVSGQKVNYTFFTFVNKQDNIINGGEFGIEGSLITLLILLFICLIEFFKNHIPNFVK
jgi:membrane protease YdiL (CAAX protease family)